MSLDVHVKVVVKKKSSKTEKLVVDAVGRAKSVFDAFKFRKQKHSEGSLLFSDPDSPLVGSGLAGAPSGSKTLSPAILHNESDAASEKSIESSSIFHLRREDPVLASAVFHVELESASKSGLQWFELALKPEPGLGELELPQGGRLAMCLASLSYSSPADKGGYRSCSMLSLPSDKVQCDYLTLLENNTAPKIPVWRRHWAVLSGTRILLYEFQHKEVSNNKWSLDNKPLLCTFLNIL